MTARGACHATARGRPRPPSRACCCRSLATSPCPQAARPGSVWSNCRGEVESAGMTTLEQLLCNRALARLLPGWWRSSAELVESARGGMFADARQLHELRSLRPAAARCSLPVPSCARVLACRVQLTPAPVPSCIRFAGYRCFSVTTPLTRRQASTLKVRPPHTSGRVSWCASCCSRPGSVRASDERACLCTRTARGARHTAHGTQRATRRPSRTTIVR